MMDGTYKNSSAPFGYDYVNGKLQINPERANVVKQIFNFYLNGIGMHEIASRLNTLGVREEIWRHGTIHQILTNEKYIGDSLLQKRFTTDTLPFKSMRNRGEKEKYYISQKSADNCNIRQIKENTIQEAFIRLWNKLKAYHKDIITPVSKQIESLYEREKSANIQLAVLRKEIAEIKQQMHLLTVLNSQGTLDEAYFKTHSQELDRKLSTVQKQLRANLDGEDNERLDNIRKLIGIFEKAESINEFDEIKFTQIVNKITVLSEKEIQFDLIGGIGFTERIER